VRARVVGVGGLCMQRRPRHEQEREAHEKREGNTTCVHDRAEAMERPQTRRSAVWMHHPLIEIAEERIRPLHELHIHATGVMMYRERYRCALPVRRRSLAQRVCSGAACDPHKSTRRRGAFSEGAFSEGCLAREGSAARSAEKERLRTQAVERPRPMLFGNSTRTNDYD